MKHSAAPWRPAGPSFVALVIGCGLIGGSVARALTRRWPKVRIHGVDRAAVLARARGRRVVHRAVPLREVEHHIEHEGVDLVVLALPLDGIAKVLPSIARASLRSCAPPMVIDVGSVKGPILELAEAHQCPRFVGGHPMAGNERGGFDTSSASVFDGSRFALCPSTRASAPDLNRAKTLVRGLGAKPIVLDPTDHDRAVAITSHLPHIAAWTLMDLAMRSDGSFSARGLPWELAAGSWRDATRVAAADPRVWASILDHNRDAITGALDQWITALQRLRTGLDAQRNDLLEGGDRGIDAAAIARERRRIAQKLPPGTARRPRK